ncbi:MAG: hypothetical protein IIW14_02600 [Kiritimatiellae bacterium]|nr:hypothetical protein [Kiritimatiellia bacterium]
MLLFFAAKIYTTTEAIARKIPVIEVDRKKLDAMTADGNHQGIVAMAAMRNYVSIDDILAAAAEKGEAPLIAVCDSVEDPHNLGAMIRSAECAGFHGMIITKRHSATLTATVAKASAGAIEHLPIAKVANLPTAIDELKKKGVWPVHVWKARTLSYRDTFMKRGMPVSKNALMPS